MADTDYMEGLSGPEIITDFLAQIETHLSKDCNLRDSDSYPNGYKGKATIHLELYGIDPITIDVEIPLGEAKAGAEVTEVVHEVIDVEHETDLNEVRERSEQAVPVVTTGDEGEPIIKKRKYTRRLPVGGGAGEF